MSLTPEQIKLLEAPLNPKHIAKRSKGGTQLSYIEGYHAIDEANRIFGFDGWSHAVNTIQLLDNSHYEKNGKEHYVITYLARVCVTINGKTSEDVGTGTADQTNAGDAHEMAVKTAVTDGLKRALRVFGAQFGNTHLQHVIRFIADQSIFTWPASYYRRQLIHTLQINKTIPF